LNTLKDFGHPQNLFHCADKFCLSTGGVLVESIEYSPLYCRRPGGEKIYSVFDNQLPAALKKLPFDKHLSMNNVRKIVSEADGYQPHLIAPEQGYRRLIESSLLLFRGPAEAVVDAVCALSELTSFSCYFYTLLSIQFLVS